MIRTTQEFLLGGCVPLNDFKAFLQAFIEPARLPRDIVTLMLLEKQPAMVVSPEKRQDLLLFSELPSNVDMASFTSGRIFNVCGELRWEKQPSHVQVVYAGDKTHMPTFNHSREESLAAYRPVTRRYLLFGKKLEAKERERIGHHVTRAGDFAEVRIPRLLRYPALPTLADAPYIKLTTCEYIDPTTGRNMAYRFKKLVPCKEPLKQEKV